MEKTKAAAIIDRIAAEKNLSQVSIAETCGMSRSYLCRLINGSISLTPEKERQIKSSFPDMFRGEMPEIGIPYFNIDFCLGYDSVFNDQTEIPDLYVRHPLNGHADCWITTRGNSMYPLISSGDIIAIREVQIDGVMFGDVYAIVTDDNRTVKRVRKGSVPSKWRLVPENKDDYDEQEIDIDSVIKVYRVEAVAKPL